MEIIIPLPQCSSANTYQELKSYLKQLELAIHHAQKSVESAEKEGIELSDDSYVNFRHSYLENSLKLNLSEDKDNKTLENFMDNYYEELQQVELHINLD